MEELASEIFEYENVINKSINIIKDSKYEIKSVDVFSSEILSAIRELEFKLEQLELKMEELDVYNENKKFLYIHKQKIKSFSSGLKKANEEYKYKLKTIFFQQMKNELLYNSKNVKEENGKNKRSNKRFKDIEGSKYITESLKRTKKYLKKDLEIGADSLEELNKQTEILQKIGDGNKSIIQEAKESYTIIGSLSNKEFLNKLVNTLTFFIFVLVAFYVFNKRIPVTLVIRKSINYIIKIIKILWIILRFFKNIIFKILFFIINIFIKNDIDSTSVEETVVNNNVDL